MNLTRGTGATKEYFGLETFDTFTFCIYEKRQECFPSFWFGKNIHFCDDGFDEMLWQPRLYDCQFNNITYTSLIVYSSLIQK